MPRNLVLGAFADDHALLDAVRAARENGLRVHDTYTPYPVHGMDEAMGLPRPILAKICFAAGVGGILTALGFQYWTSALDWPLIVGGKPYGSIPALIPITFEVMVLSAAVTTTFAFFALARLWPGRKPDLLPEGATDDRFIVAIEAGSRRDAARELLRETGAIEVREVEAP